MPLPHTKLDVQNNATLQKYTNPPTYLSQQETEYDYPHTSFSGPKPHIHWNGVSPPTSTQTSDYLHILLSCGADRSVYMFRDYFMVHRIMMYLR